MAAHTHDGIDWVARLADLRQADESNAAALRAVADRLVESLPAPQPTVIDVGCGAGGMSAALAAALVGRAVRAATGATDLVATPPPAANFHTAAGLPVTNHGDPSASAPAIPVATTSDAAAGDHAGLPAAAARGTLVLVDAVPELLAAAGEVATAAVGGSDAVTVRSAPADIADSASFVGLPAADLVWAANVAHHLPDQRAAISTLVSLLAPGGMLALSEGGLSMRCLPWDLGVGEPGLQDRLIAAHGAWFHQMRTGMTGVVRMPVGWNRVLCEAGLGGVTSFSYLVDVPAPLSDAGRGAVVSWLTWMTHATADLLNPADLAALQRLLDPADSAYVALRDDVFMLKANTVYLGWR